MFESMEISSSALTAYRTRMNIIANNTANIDTTRDADGNSIPFRRKLAMFAPGANGLGKGQGVSIREIIEDPKEFKKVHWPKHPDAVKSGPDAGYVYFPNIDREIEMVDMIMAARAYEANVTAFEASKSIVGLALRLLS